MAPYRLYNIGNEQPVELLRYIEVLEQCLGRKAQMELLPLQAGDVPDTEADVSDLIANVGYRPQVQVEEGVAKFVDWYRGYYEHVGVEDDVLGREAHLLHQDAVGALADAHAALPGRVDLDAASHRRHLAWRS